ncbi:high affinity immunoglobulin gamma Fc receptor I-like [Notolabrus celidotus]|uniref:high affinity immunoglobulin gamma Fc receptor I-like n=1 Tax=Notolabrus celidotus TaxID=1203425 RepID=UPI00148F62C1|nr:high affinity immunoglobulin gamma Fc receptor I-like [Notolabrus celidotus]
MKVSALRLLLLLNSLDSASARVSVTVSPERSQFFKYERFSVSCEDEEKEQVTGWKVMKRMMDGEVHPCPSCSISAAFPFTDSGEYWCQSGQGATSNSVNISVTAGLVILDSPVHPVIEGDNVTLSCRHKSILTPTEVLNTEFFKDGRLIGRSSTGNMTIYRVSKSDEGFYKCKVNGPNNESEESWLTVRAAPPTGQDPQANLFFPVVRHLVVGCPYLLSTILLGLIGRDRIRALHAEKRRQKSDDVIMEMAQYRVGHPV